LILDNSAIVAIATGEPDRENLVRAMAQSPQRAVGSPTLLETGMVLISRVGVSGRTALATFCAEFDVEEIAFTTDHRRVSLDAFERFGKGRHPASLNLGDCPSYATARIARRPLLCIGNHFAQTDLDLVDLA
jgi:ribonuclease VapC